MPITGREKIVFLTLMAFLMTAGMESYNLMMQGVSPRRFAVAMAVDLPMMCAVVMAVQHFIGGPLAKKIAFRFVTPGLSRPSGVIFCVSAVTVMIMCPLMSLIATLIFKRQSGEIVQVWFETLLFNLPIAFLWQMLVAGPLVRRMFRWFFRPQSLS